jgi:hypothetical protein
MLGLCSHCIEPADPRVAVAAIEAVFGLWLEITCIATFTQRVFAR